MGESDDFNSRSNCSEKYSLNGSDIISAILFHKFEKAISELDKKLEIILLAHQDNLLIKEAFPADKSYGIIPGLDYVLSIMSNGGSLDIGGLGKYFYVKSLKKYDEKVRSRISPEEYEFLHDLGRQIDLD